MTLDTLGASGYIKISSVLGWNDLCALAPGCSAKGVGTGVCALARWWLSARGMVVLLSDGGSATIGCAFPSKLAKLGRPRHVLTALVQSLPIWFLIAQTRLFLSVKALQTCLPASQDSAFTGHLPSFHAAQMLSPLLITEALF